MAKTIEDAVYDILETTYPDECVELRDALGLAGDCGWDGEIMPPDHVCAACCDRMARAIAGAFDGRKGE